jgi:glutamine amidotransferase-like uncharacterized protein
MTILIYSDLGAGPRSVRLLVKSLKFENLDRQFTIKRVDNRFLKSENWEQNTRLLIFPGGRDTPYHQALQGYANQKIRNYLENGGAYLGICAGGYFGSAHVEFEKGHPLEVVAQRELKFFPGMARGPAFGPTRFRYEDESGSCVAELLWENDNELESASVYFNGGCEFVDAEKYSNIQVLARYQNIPHAPAAIIECQIGLGKAILSGVHPEYSALDLANQAAHASIPLSVLPRLKEREGSRQKLFRSLLNRVLIQE